jgi:hypothetical protein
MPKKIQNFARSALVKPVTINVGRAGAASMNVIQVRRLGRLVSNRNTNTRNKVADKKVKVKVSLEQATKAQRGSRGIALLFL